MLGLIFNQTFMAKTQIHKRLSDEQVRVIIERFNQKELSVKEALRYLEIGRSRFYEILEKYKKFQNFSLKYERQISSRSLDPKIEENILKELAVEKEKIIDNPLVPVNRYNYSYIKNLLAEKYDQKVSLPTVIDRAKENGYWKAKRKIKKIHDREVLTNYTGELIQHDSSHHLFAPLAEKKWYLITSIDDYSRAMLYAELVESETTWTHISALQNVFSNFGTPFSYYADQHAIFRYIKDRDKQSPFNNYTKFTDDVDTQWRQVLKECGVKPIYALSPQAKGKAERPYEWLQDHLVRTCLRENVTEINHGREILKQEINSYNWKRIHSTTGEIPMRRLEQAKEDNKTLFREFSVPEPFLSSKDIFCLRITRTVDSYRKVSLKNLEIKVPGVAPRQEVEIRLYPDFKTNLVEARFWHNGHFTGLQNIAISDIPLVRF